jgi:hypothetical protein
MNFWGKLFQSTFSSFRVKAATQPDIFRKFLPRDNEMPKISVHCVSLGVYLPIKARGECQGVANGSTLYNYKCSQFIVASVSVWNFYVHDGSQTMMSLKLLRIMDILKHIASGNTNILQFAFVKLYQLLRNFDNIPLFNWLFTLKIGKLYVITFI